MPAATVKLFETGDYDAHIRQAADLLARGQLVIIPTETVYGAAAALTHPASLARLRSLPPPLTSQPLVIHLAHRDHAARYLGPLSDLARRMIRKLWPGPVALIFDVPPDRQRLLAAELKLPLEEIYNGPTITLRCPDHVVAADALALVPCPVVIRRAADSAHTPALNADLAASVWGQLVDLILDAGPTKYAKPSTVIRIADHHYNVVRDGVYDRRIIERLLRTTLLFVCSGNTCRSPMAEGLARKILADKLHLPQADLEHKGYSVLSAGSFALPDAKATPAAVQALQSLGVDLSRHRSRPLTVELIHQADVIFTMTRSHTQAVVALVPSASDKTLPLNPENDIEDPIGGDVALYQALARQLHSLVETRLAEHSLP